MQCRSVLLILLAWTVGAIGAQAQQDACLTRNIPVSVVSRGTAPSPKITESSFEATFKQRPVRINSVTRDQKPRRILMLLDVSGSMDKKLKGELDVADDFLGHMPQTIAIGLATFDTKLLERIPPVQDRAVIKAEVDSRRSTDKFKGKGPFGKTAIWDAVRDGVKLLNSDQVGDVIFLITDGDTNMGIPPSEATLALIQSGVRLFALVAVDPERPGSRDYEMTYGSATKLGDVARETGGSAAFPPLRDDFHGRLWRRLVDSGRVGSSIQTNSLFLSFECDSARAGRQDHRLAAGPRWSRQTTGEGHCPHISSEIGGLQIGSS